MKLTHYYNKTNLEEYKITKPIRLIELFSGYGSQALALKYLGVKFEHHRTCEWAVKSIQAYKDMHFGDDYKTEVDDLDKDFLVQKLFELGISSNYNEPMTKQSIERLPIDKLRIIYSNILVNNNLVNIQNVKGEDLGIVDIDSYEYFVTYSFPCQDLSLSGKRKGMNDTSTRSGMLWEVERILYECKELGTLPQVLIMENVPQVHGKDNMDNFEKWQKSLKTLGYNNYWQDLIATDFGIPQTRNRTFMISILGDYNYIFPKPVALERRLKDFLELEVDDSYYLSDKMISRVQKWNAYEKPLENMIKTDKKQLSPTITTRSGADAAGMILVMDNNNVIDNIKDTKNYIQWEEEGQLEMKCRAWKDKSPSLTTSGNDAKILIPEATKKGYAEATDGDGVYINRPHQKRDCVQKDRIQTLTTSQDVGVVVGMYPYAKSDNFMQGKDRFQEGKDIADTILTSGKEGVVIGSLQEHATVYTNGLCPTLPTAMGAGGGHVPMHNYALKIRKLTEREAFRLMGVKDEDFVNVEKNQPKTSLYHLAGDSIVTFVLVALFGQMIPNFKQDDFLKILDEFYEQINK